MLLQYGIDPRYTNTRGDAPTHFSFFHSPALSFSLYLTLSLPVLSSSHYQSLPPLSLSLCLSYWPSPLGLKAIDLAIRNKQNKCKDLLAEYHLHYCTSSDFDSVLFLKTLEVKTTCCCFAVTHSHLLYNIRNFQMYSQLYLLSLPGGLKIFTLGD